MTDPIADLIIRIKNALLAHKREVVLPHSKIKHSIAQILEQEGYVAAVTVREAKPVSEIVISLKYVGKLPAVNGVKRLSTPGRRLYSSVSGIPRTLNGYGITIISTSKGVMTDTAARKQNIGGELLCQIW